MRWRFGVDGAVGFEVGVFGVVGRASSSLEMSEWERFLKVRGGVCGDCALMFARFGAGWSGFFGLGRGAGARVIGLAREGTPACGVFVMVGGAGRFVVRRDCSALQLMFREVGAAADWRCEGGGESMVVDGV